MIKGRLLSGVVSIVMLAFNAYAEDPADLGRIVVTPYRYEEVIGKTAASVMVVTAADIKKTNARTVPDVLRSLPGITLRDWYGNGTKVAVDMAGFGEQGALNVLVLVDGRRINDVDLAGVDWSQVPLDQVERVEIIRGGSAGVLYGDNASSGVISIITKRGEGKTKVDLRTEYGSYAYHAERLSVGGGIDNKFSYWVNGGHDATNGYRKNSFNKASDFASKFSFELTDRVSLRLSAGTHKGSYGMPGALWQGHIDQHGRRYARYGEDYAKTRDSYVVLGGDVQGIDSGNFSADVSYRHKDTDSFFLSSGNPMQRNEIETVGFTPKYTLTTAFLGHDNRLISGIDLYRSFYRSRQFHKTNDRVLNNYTNVNKSSAAIYAQDEFSLFEPLTLVNGYRYETARYAFGYHDNDTVNWGHPFPDQDKTIRPQMRAFNSGLVYSYRKGSSVFVDAGKSFRFPEVDEFTFQDQNFQQQLNTELKPQSAVTFQAGVRHEFSDSLNGSVSVFRMNVQDELYYNSNGGPSGFGKNENYDRTVHQGLESSAEMKLTDRITSFGNYTYTQAWFKDGAYSKNEIPLVPRHKASIGLRVLLLKELALNIVDTYVGRRYTLNDQANTKGRVNGYMVVDTNLSWNVKDFTTTFGINNVFDTKYAEMAGYAWNSSTGVSDRFYYPSPGRTFNITADYRF